METYTSINLERFSRTYTAWKTTKSPEWIAVHGQAIEDMLMALPSGSGIDNGVKFDYANSQPQKLVFTFGFHHMADGYYTGWTYHKLIVTPVFGGCDLKITGPDKNQIKEYLYQVFGEVFQ